MNHVVTLDEAIRADEDTERRLRGRVLRHPQDGAGIGETR